MNLFRSHIPKISVTLALLFSLLLHFVQPVNESAKHSAFTTWLGTHLKNHDDASVLKKLQELGNSSDELESVIRNASAFVTSNAEDFELDFQKSDQNEIFRLLLTEWISFMDSQQGMAKSVIVTTAKANGIQQNDSKTLTKSALFNLHALQTPTTHSTLLQNKLAVTTTPSPLSFGIVIGAP
ncbi:MAG: hypothetical protein WC967_10550 [Balneolaceae bacterium]